MFEVLKSAERNYDKLLAYTNETIAAAITGALSGRDILQKRPGH